MLQYWRKYQEAMIEAAQINDPEERAKVEEEIKKFYSEKFANIERDN
jgi:predicted secreted protein